MRQLIYVESHPASVCSCVCASGIQSTCGYSAMQRNSSYTRHTLGQVSAYMQHACTYGHRCCNSINSDDRVRHLATLKKRKQREKDCGFNSKSPSTYLLATAFTIDFHMPLSHSLFTQSIYRHRMQCTNTRGIYRISN